MQVRSEEVVCMYVRLLEYSMSQVVLELNDHYCPDIHYFVLISLLKLKHGRTVECVSGDCV